MRHVLLLLLLCASCRDTQAPHGITTPLEAVPFAALGAHRVLLERHSEDGVALYLIDPATQTSTIVASDASVRGAALSPSGTRIAYTTPAPELANGYDLYVFDIGGPPLRLTQTVEFEGMPTWESSGTSLVYPTAFAASGATIARISATGAPPSAQVLFSSSAGACPHPEFATPVERSAADDLLIVCRAGIWKISALHDTTELYTTTQASAVHAARWSPDGQQVAFLEPRSGELLVRVLSIATGEVATVVSVPSQATNMALFNIYSLCWTADASRLLFTAPESQRVAHLWMVRVDGTNLTQVTTAAAFDHNVSCARVDP